MSDRTNAIVVVLDEEIRVSDAEPLLVAIRQLKGVISAEPHVTTIEDLAAEVRVKTKLRRRLFEIGSEL